MQNQVIFDAATHPPWQWWLLGLASIPLARLTRNLWRRVGGRDGRRLVESMIPASLAAGATVIVGLIALVTAEQYLVIRTRIARGHIRILEGVVTRFTPEPAGGHGFETWSLVTGTDTVVYRYSSAEPKMGLAYDQLQRDGSPIRDGRRVRVIDIDGDIVRLEVVE